MKLLLEKVQSIGINGRQTKENARSTAVELCLCFVSYYKVFFNENFLAALTLPGEVDVFGNEYPEFEWVDFEPEE